MIFPHNCDASLLALSFLLKKKKSRMSGSDIDAFRWWSATNGIRWRIVRTRRQQGLKESHLHHHLARFRIEGVKIFRHRLRKPYLVHDVQYCCLAFIIGCLFVPCLKRRTCKFYMQSVLLTSESNAPKNEPE